MDVLLNMNSNGMFKPLIVDREGEREKIYVFLQRVTLNPSLF